MLDNGDGAVRCGLNGFPSANIPANCSGTVTFANKQSQSTLPVKSYQLVIDSCSVIDQQSGEMEMHLALIVDGYKFAQTGFYFRYLPNSIAQLALPEWELVSVPTTLISLDVDDNSLVGYEFDGDYRVLTYIVGSAENYIAVVDDSIAMRISEVSEGQYSCVIDEESLRIDSSVDNPYDVDEATVQVVVTGHGPGQSDLICDIIIQSDSGDGDSKATGVRCTEGALSLISLDSFVLI